MRRATDAGWDKDPSLGQFQSTLSMRRATLPLRRNICDYRISIHALHEESDVPEANALGHSDISIHALHEESDENDEKLDTAPDTISIHALHEESDHLSADYYPIYNISIHALHEESDSAAGHFCPLFETQASCLALSISNNTADTTNNMSKTSNWLSVSF